MAGFLSRSSTFTHIFKPNLKTKPKRKEKIMYSTIISRNVNEEFRTTALSYCNTVSDHLNVMLNPNDCTIEEVFYYLRDNGEQDTAKELLSSMKEDRLERDDLLCDLSDSDTLTQRLNDRFCEYGLEWNFRPDSVEDGNDDYFYFLVTFGGPNVEVRFTDWGNIEFTYFEMDRQISFNVSQEQPFKSLGDFYDDCDMMNFAEKREEETCFI